MNCTVNGDVFGTLNFAVNKRPGANLHDFLTFGEIHVYCGFGFCFKGGLLPSLEWPESDNSCGYLYGCKAEPGFVYLSCKDDIGGFN